VHCQNIFFDNVATMVLDYFDVPDRNNTIFVLGSYAFQPISYFRSNFPNKKIVIYQLEQMMGGQNFNNPHTIIKNIVGADEIWDYDHLNIHWMSKFDVKVDRLVPMLYSKKLEWNTAPQENPDFDSIFMGFLTKDRFEFFRKFQRDSYGKLKFSWIYGDDNIEKHTLRSKTFLNIHAFEPWNRQEQVRMFVPIINKRTVVSQVSQRNYLEESIVEVDQDLILESLIDICRSDKWKNFGIKARDIFIEKTNSLLKQWPETYNRII